MNWTLFATAFGASWTFVANMLSKVPFLTKFLAFATGPLGAFLGPIMADINAVIVSAVKFVFAYLKLFLDGLTVTMKNLSVLAVIFAGIVGGVYGGVQLDRKYLAKPKVTVAMCKPVIDELHARFSFVPKKPKGLLEGIFGQ